MVNCVYFMQSLQGLKPRLLLLLLASLNPFSPTHPVVFCIPNVPMLPICHFFLGGEDAHCLEQAFPMILSPSVLDSEISVNILPLSQKLVLVYQIAITQDIKSTL